MFTDIHTHILPGVDDGCKNFNESMDLIKSELKNNVRRVVVTPHFSYDNLLNREILLTLIEILIHRIKENNLDIEIYPGVELNASFKILEFLKNNDFLTTFFDKGKYILMEIPFHNLPYNFNELLFKIKLLGLVPILAHPERNDYMRENFGYMKKLRNEGLLVQLNNSSLINKNDLKSFQAAARMLRMDMVDVIASDCHCIKGRFSNFIDAYRILKKLVGRVRADRIAIENPNRILLNEDIL